MSNKLSKRRSVVQHPKICVAAGCPPPPPPEPCGCQIEPAVSTIFNTETQTLFIWACCPHLPDGEDTELSVETTLGDIHIDNPPDNCMNKGEFELDPAESVGDAHIVAEVRFSDMTIVQCEALVHVIEENGNGNGNRNGNGNGD